MRKLRQVQKGLPYGSRYDGQLEKKKERHGVYSLYGMCEKLSQRRTVKQDKIIVNIQNSLPFNKGGYIYGEYQYFFIGTLRKCP